jgi:hypothetical protein
MLKEYPEDGSGDMTRNIFKNFVFSSVGVDSDLFKMPYLSVVKP